MHLAVIYHASLVIEHHLFSQLSVYSLVDLFWTVREYFVFYLLYIHLFVFQRFSLTLFILWFVCKFISQPPKLHNASAFHGFKCLREYILYLICYFKHNISESILDFSTGIF